MAIPETTRASILHALREFDRNLRHTAEWQGWRHNANYEWALVHRSNEYPVKHIIHIATGYPKSEFSGGPEANGYVRALGFIVRHLDPAAEHRPTRFWAFFANPKRYRIEEALDARDEDSWTVKHSDVRLGDRALEG